jgi:outer membrane translocation and assembly module TamA
LIQSFKASTADYYYTMPELIGEDIDVFLNASILQREEVSFTREEFGGGAGATTFLSTLDSDFGLRYNYQVVTATESDVDLEDQVRSAEVGALIADLKHDRRDNPLYPRNGYKLAASLEYASEFLAGSVNYERFELAASYHLPFSRGRWLHFGFSHGAAVTTGGADRDLPFNKRFFPGGENSIRGYQQGEASPRNEDGDVVGAESYILGIVEVEQALTPSWAVVGFVDAMGLARDLSQYPMDETLYTAGAGIRWKTLIGPARLEYGYNLNRRKGDPSGTLHFSIGFPF